MLSRNRSFTAAALVVLALGVGTSTAVFSAVSGVLLTPLAYRQPDRIVLARADLPGYRHQAALTAEELLALRQRTDVFESVAVINQSEGNLTARDHMAAVTAASISDNFFETLGVAPLIGRSVSRTDIGAQWVSGVDIGYEVWQRQFKGDPGIIGRQVELNNRLMTIVGVLPRDFRLYLGPGVEVPTRVDIWYPRAAGYDLDPFRGQVVVARLRSGVSLASARGAVDTIAADLVARHPFSYRTGAVRLAIETVDREVVSAVKPALSAMTGAVAFVLAVACANLANLLLARASARRRELAVRISIGASRRDIIRQLASEGLLLGTIGAAAGLLLAQWCVDLLVRLAPAVLPHREAIRLDGSATLFAVTLSLLCTVIVSLVPAWHVTRSNIAHGLKEDSSSSRTAGTIRGALTASQLALSLVLLVGAGLMTRTFIGMRLVPLGFDASTVLTMNVALQMQRFGTGTLEEARLKRLVFYHQLAESARRIPGVEQVGIGLPAPLSGGGFISQRFATDETAPEQQAEGIVSLAGFLETLRVPLIEGRYFTVDDDDRPVIIVDSRIADELWPQQSAIGRRLLLKSLRPRWAEVVGVVAHVQTQDIRRDGPPQIWMTYATKSYAELNIIARGPNARALAPMVERAVQQLGPGRPVHDVRLLEDYVADATADTRFALFVLAAFAIVAFALAVIGVYGVVAYTVARRMREIAVRIALGAAPDAVVLLVVQQGVTWSFAGVLGGLGGSLLLVGRLRELLFRVGEHDPLTFAVVAALLSLIVVVTMALAARRATRIDPMQTLRAE